MFWLGILLAVIAITVTLVKELFEGVKGEDTILHLSIGELVLALLSVGTTLSKHLIKHNDVIKSQKRVRTHEQHKRQNADKQMTQRRKVQIALVIVLLCFVVTIVTGFMVLHKKDDETHAFLTYTKFITVFTLFLSIILDGIIDDILSDYLSLVKIDQCKLAVHQLNLELHQALKVVGEEERAKTINQFLENHEVFTLEDYFIYLSPQYNKPNGGETHQQQQTVTRKGEQEEGEPLVNNNEASDWV